MKRIAILGSTGSIGNSTLKIVEAYPERFRVVSLAAGKNIDVVFEQACRWKPKMISVSDEHQADALRERLRGFGHASIEVVHGPAGNVSVATHPEADFVVSAIVGVAGLEATYEAVKAGKSVGLANKESLVVAGELITAVTLPKPVGGAQSTFRDIIREPIGPNLLEHREHVDIRRGRRDR